MFVSSAAVYARQDPQHPHAETDPLGGLASYEPSYPIGKIAAEGAVRAAARMLNLPTTIARMNIGIGPHGGGGAAFNLLDIMRAGAPVPVPVGYDNWGSPIAAEDIAAQASGPLFDIASVPATVINWAGDDPVNQREMCTFIGELAGISVTFEENPIFNLDAFVADNTKRLELIGPCKTNWRDALRSAIYLRYPDLTSTS